MDALYIGIGVAFFLMTWLLVYALGRLGGGTTT
jgi:hypothetical protein